MNSRASSPGSAPPVVLVTGGAGYIGAHVVLALNAAGLRAVVLDDLSTGDRHAIPAGNVFVHGDVGDERLLTRILTEHAIEAILHFAGSIIVSESVVEPIRYYRNNAVKSLALIAAAVRHGVGRFIFSSSAAVYGAAERVPIDEDASLLPITPYGASKLMTERMLVDVGAAMGLRHVILRYFNVAGADALGRAGQFTPWGTHLIKVACEVAVGQRSHVEIFGTDYPTPDGTCIRDYVHVSDLAEAHVLALRYLLEGGPSAVLNCGYTRGYSVREVLAAVGEANGSPLAVVETRRRIGDPPQLVAAAHRIGHVLGWQPRRNDLALIVRSALDWERRRVKATLGSARS